MKEGHKLRLEEIDVTFNNAIEELHVRYGLESELQSQAHRNAIDEILTRIKAEAVKADEEYEKSKTKTSVEFRIAC